MPVVSIAAIGQRATRAKNETGEDPGRDAKKGDNAAAVGGIGQHER